jgi:cell wall-associated NlpC family hydrolase
VYASAVSAEPAAITEAKSEAEALRDRIDELSQQLDAAVEDYNYASARLAQTQEAIAKTQADLTKAEEDFAEANARLTARLVEIYKAGELSALDTLMGSSSFSELINRLDTMKRLSEQDAQLVADVGAYQDEVETRKAELTQQLADERQLTADAKAAKAKVAEQLTANKQALQGKEALIAQLEKEEAVRQARLAAEARARAEAARKQAAAEAAAKAAAEEAAAAKAQQDAAAGGESNGGTAKTSPATAPTTSPQVAPQPKPETTVSASAADVVSIAMDYLGVPYVWAGASPDGFDCSGFVMYVYRKVGIKLPHSSRLQFGYGTAVSRDELRPGDLVFFFSPISHVGIYIGDGQMIHAAGSGKNVRISDVWTNSYAGARRIID